MKLKFLVPLLAFVGIAVFLWQGLSLKPREIPSVFIDKPAPEFVTDRLFSQNTISTQDMLGEVWLLNVWASWCAACKDEHPLINALAEEKIAPIVGLNYKDTPEDAIAWLAQFGNPYSSIAQDQAGDIGIDYGVYGVPETFLIDKKGQIRYKQIGPITAEILNDKIRPMLMQLVESS